MKKQRPLKNLYFLINLPMIALLSSCASEESAPSSLTTNELTSKWSGAAEISHYELKQERYGKIVTGESVFIYVREPFLKDRQVKDESGRGNFDVLKLNATREFRTGIYPYHAMMSVFQPLNKDSVGKALKVTTSVQDWCGHEFVQTNRRSSKTATRVFSYFEKKEGSDYSIDSSVMLEDEVWTALRINPSGLPVGEIEMVPGSLAVRFNKLEPLPLKAVTRWKNGKSVATIFYEINYIQTGRTLSIEIQKGFPYRVESWSESNKNGLLSSGKLVKRLENVEYWNLNTDPEGKKIRNKLKLK